LQGRRIVGRAVRWLLQARRTALDVNAELDRFAIPLAKLLDAVPDLLQGHERELIASATRRRAEQGVPHALAARAASLPYAFPLLHIIEIAADTGEAVEDVAALYYALSATFDVDPMLRRIAALPHAARWQELARAELQDDLYRVLNNLTADVIATTAEGPAAPRIAAWEQANAPTLARTRTRLAQITATESPDLAAMSIAVRTLRTTTRRVPAAPLTRPTA